MGCAAFGNLASVIVGVLMGERVEKLAMKLGDDSLSHLKCSRFRIDDNSNFLFCPSIETVIVNCRTAAARIIVDAARACFGQSVENSRLGYWCYRGLYHRHASFVLDRPF